MKTFKIGGCVRDDRLGVRPKDVDRVVVLEGFFSVEEGFLHMVQNLESQGFVIFQKHPSSLTVRARHPSNKEVADFVLARKETYGPESRVPLVSLGTLLDDQRRRDFTLNTLAQDEDGAIIDPFGGQKDLEARVLRTPMDPKSTMLEDPLRVLRALRFSVTLGCTIHPELQEVMFDSDILERMGRVVSKERIQIELNKMFAHDTFGGFQTLAKTPKEFQELCFSGGLKIQTTFKTL
jgi:poly(A) polymerase